MNLGSKLRAPSGANALALLAFCGTAEGVPYPKPIDELAFSFRYSAESFWRVALTPETIPTPRRTIAPTAIQCAGMCIKCAA